MNFGKLLGTGKTFFGGGGKVAYRENRRVYLPKFNAEKNPFAPKSAEPAPVTAPAAASDVKRVITPIAAETQKIPVVAAPQTKQPMPTRVMSWTDKLNPFRTLPSARPVPQSAVQVELSLEAVKVVHNDLADADIEIVPVKSRTVAQPEAPVLPPARASWEFLGERLVKQI
jgi:hypothetical protein